MPQLLVPDSRFRSNTAANDQADMRDENIFSAVVLAHAGSGSAKLFTAPQGQSITELKGSSITATANAHQTTFTELTTNLTKAGELGSAVGDAGIRALGVTIEQAGLTTSQGGTRSFGATIFEVADIASKCALELRVGGKKQIEGPVFMFPNLGAVQGAVAGGNTSNFGSIANNGSIPAGRKLKIPIMCGRSDTLVCEFRVAGSATLAFSNTATDGQPTLVWVCLLATVKGDVR